MQTPMKFKAICTDIDGTLLDSRRELSDATIESFQKVKDDVAVILASSRMPSAMRHLQDQLGVIDQPLICYNGGYIVHYNNGYHPEVVHSVVIPVNVCEEIIALAEGTTIHVSLYFEDEWYAPQWDQWTEREARITKVQPKLSDLPSVIERWRSKNSGGHKVMCMGPENEIDAMEKALNEKLSDHIHIYRSRPTYLELAPKAISKGSGLKLLLQKKFSIGIGEVISFGDNYNDIDLLQLSGRGVAVENAREEVKAVADEITLDSKADGVAASIRKHFLNH
jgi:Cof subfamily protein (haloacid dehalogenase superfamily)